MPPQETPPPEPQQQPQPAQQQWQQPAAPPPPPPASNDRQTPAGGDPYAAYKGGMEKVDPDEQVLAEVHRHPFGLIALYLQTFIGIIIGTALVYFLLHGSSSLFTIDPQVSRIIVAVGFVALTIAILFLLVSTSIYRRSKLIITNKTVTQIIQTGLFGRKVSQLSLQDVEDVNTDVQGPIQTMLKFGTLNVETAGEAENFNFRLCPSCDACAKMILEARQRVQEPDTHV